ncbi:MAG: nascent polypeptide-associated complex protein [Candidatus Diapherotrites archaeon]
MFPGKMNPKQLQGMMKAMGIKTEEVNAQKVVIELADKKLVFEKPQVTAMTVQGQTTYTLVGEAKSEEKGISEEDIEMVAQQTGASKAQAEKALKEANGDLAKAIVQLKK